MKFITQLSKRLFYSLFGQYKGMRKELYVLFWGKAATNMGAMIWPMLTLILSNKLGMEAGQIASVTITLGIIELPISLLGGKLADHCNKRNLIICCDLVTVVCYLLAAAMPVSMGQIGMFFIASMFQVVENPAYDALVADLSTTEYRDKAYSLIYLGMNLGLVLAPSIGGLLFQYHLNLAYVIDGLTTLSSTILIFFFIKDIKPVEEAGKNIYETAKTGESMFKILSRQKIFFLFFLCLGMYSFLYTQYNFLIPLNLEMLYSAQGAVYFGFLTSLNGLIVIVGTPVLTKLLGKTPDLTKLIVGQVLVWLSLGTYIFIQGMIPMYYVSMFFFTIGEIITTLGKYPYITKRIPSSHRGRISSASNLVWGCANACSQAMIGGILEQNTIIFAWKCIAVIGAAGFLCYMILRRADRKIFRELY